MLQNLNSTIKNTILSGRQMVNPVGIDSARQNTGEELLNPDSEKLYGYAESLAKARENEIVCQALTHNVDQTNFIKAIAKKLFNREWKPEPVTVESLKTKESAIGGSLFYTGRPNERFEFWNDNLRSWFFYQELSGTNGAKHSTTLHYEVNPLGILKVNTNTGINCKYIRGEERDEFMLATSLYYERVMKYLYKQDIDLDKTPK